MCLLLLTTVSFFVSNISAQKSISLLTELERMHNIAAMPQYIDGSSVKQISSYDRTGGNDDGFSGKYSYIRKEGKDLVLLDVKGAGVIERIWTPTPTDDMLDFYFDGASKPSYSIKFRDLFTGTVAPFIKPLVAYHLVGGYYSYVPIPFSNGCKIVFRGERIMFHQIQYREYDKSYKVKTFNPSLAPVEQKALDQVAALWGDTENSTDKFASGYKVVDKNVELKPGSSTSVAELNGGGRLLGIELKPPHAFEGLLKQIDLKVTWDNESYPAIYAPVADFFGYAFGKRAMESLLIGSTGSKAYCYFPMPFDSRARVDLVYRDSGVEMPPVKINVRIFYSNQKRVPGKEGKFYAYWKRDSPDIGKDHVFLKGNGRGHYVGTILQSQATEFTNFTEFFEGDDRTTIDGEMIAHGTGSEDYFNGGWYAQPGGWVEDLGGPVSGCMNYSLPKSQTAGYRLFIGDKMPFNKSIEHSMEHGPTNNREVDYISVAMYYADQAVAQNKEPENSTSKVFVPSTYSFYTRLMKHLSYNGGLVFRNDQANLINDEVGLLAINVNEIPKGKYKLYLYKTNDGAEQFDIKIADEKNVGEWKAISAIAASQTDIYLGDVEVDDFYVPISVLFRAKSKKPGLRFNRVMLVK